MPHNVESYLERNASTQAKECGGGIILPGWIEDLEAGDEVFVIDAPGISFASIRRISVPETKSYQAKEWGLG